MWFFNLKKYDFWALGSIMFAAAAFTSFLGFDVLGGLTAFFGGFACVVGWFIHLNN